jgi:hypothetical protein
MTRKKRRPSVLPPPAETFLLYVADGLSTWLGYKGPAEKLRTLERIFWVPMFRQLAASDDGVETLHKLAATGMRTCNCLPCLIGGLNDAFRNITFRSLSIATLHAFAETARERIHLPVSAATTYQPLVAATAPQPKAKPEQQHAKRAAPSASPHRPRHQRPRGHNPAP